MVPRCVFLAIIGGVCFIGGSSGAVAQDSGSLWRDPQFRKHLVGALGINTDIEPIIANEKHQGYHDKIAPMIEDEPSKAAGYIREILEDPEASARFDFLLGSILYRGGRPRQAVTHFRAAIGKFASYRSAHHLLGVLLMETGDHKGAITHLTQAVQLGLSDGLVYGFLGTAYFQTGSYVAAESAFRNAIFLAPQMKQWKLGLATTLFSQERYTDVVALVKPLIRESPEDHSLWLIKANAHAGAKQMMNAAASFELLDEMGRLPAEKLDVLAKIYVNEGLFGLAADTFLRAYDQNVSAGIDGPLKAAEILTAREGMDEARMLLGRVKEAGSSELSNDDRKRILRLEARIGMAQGNQAEAAEIYQEVIDLDPLDGDSRIQLANYYEGIGGQEEQALALYDEAGNLKGFEADAKVRKGQLLARLSRYKEALEVLREAQNIEPREKVGRFVEELERFVKKRGG